MATGTLHFFCGKMGAGKSTNAKALASENNSVLISEDEWLAALYPEQIETFDDYRRYASRLKPVVAQHVKGLLLCGTNVVLDFPANTEKQRQWFKELSASAGAVAYLVYVKASDETCLGQIAIRRKEQPERAKFDTEEVYREVSRYFQAPAEEEGFTVQVIEK